MAYDPVKAHEYYMNYRKKGLKKGRKKGKGKTKTKTSTLLGISIAGLNDEGKIQGALIREKLKKQMNEALKSAKTDEEREKIRVEYSRKAAQQLAALKNDPKYARPKAAKKSGSSAKQKTSSGSSKQSSSKSSGSSSSKKATATPTPAYDNSAELSEQVISDLTLKADALIKLAKTMPPEAKKRVAKTVESIIKQLKFLRGE